MHFSASYDAALLLDWGAGASQLASEFFLEGIDPCIVVEMECPCGKEEGWAFYSTIFLTLAQISSLSCKETSHVGLGPTLMS